MPETPKGTRHYEKRFGIIAIRKGWITEEDLLRGLAIQVREDIEQGSHRLIGEILLDLGILNATQIEEVVKETVQSTYG